MSELATLPPPRRLDLVVRPIGEDGRHVVKTPDSGEYFTLGAQEAFLLLQLDGRQPAASIRTAFQGRFGEPLSEADFGQFVDLSRSLGFVQPAAATAGTEPVPADRPRPRTRGRQSLLYWRARLFDPDRLFTLLEPHLRFLWTRVFLLASAVAILAAAGMVWADRGALVSGFAHVQRWETWAIALFTLVAATALHEAAHGLTCKHYGGEVHEVGFLLMYFMPCFYCNVSDAWLFKEKSKRLWVTLAGGYCDLCVWAGAAFVWRLAAPHTLVNYLAWVVLSVVGARVFFNFNPLIKLDGYYLLGDALGVTNLQTRAWDRFKAHVRRLLWGAPRPAAEPRGRLLTGYGAASWLYSLAFLAAMLAATSRVVGTRWGVVAGGWVVLVGVMTLRFLLRGMSNGEVRTMIRKRHVWTAGWVLALGAVPAVLTLAEIRDTASGPFRVRSAARTEVRVPVAGFVREVFCDEGDRATPGGAVARLEVPDLASKTAAKRAEVREAAADLRMMEAGPRPEELVAERRRIERARGWRDRAARDLERARTAFEEDVQRLNHQIAQNVAELDRARLAFHRVSDLIGKGATTREDLEEVEKRYRVCQSQVEQSEAQRRAREAQGTLEAESELARRDKDLAAAEADLTLLEAGTRPERVDAVRAHLARLEEELRYYEGLGRQTVVPCPAAGLVTTPRLREKVGQYVREGDVLCTVDTPEAMEAEITLSEEEVGRVCPGQPIELRPRARPDLTLRGRVDRVGTSAAAEKDGLPGTVTVVCRLEAAGADLRPGMTGHARIDTGRRPAGAILGDRVLRVLRTEFWW